MKGLRITVNIALTCLLALGMYTVASAQGRGKGRSSAGNPNMGGKVGTPGIGDAGRGRSAPVNDGRGGDNETSVGNQRAGISNQSTGNRGGAANTHSRPNVAAAGAGTPGQANNGVAGEDHGQTVSARRRAAIEAWKASGQKGPPPWAGVGGGPGGNPNRVGQGQPNGRGAGKVKGKGKGKGKGKAPSRG